jgi:hypothetical protein
VFSLSWRRPLVCCKLLVGHAMQCKVPAVQSTHCTAADLLVTAARVACSSKSFRTLRCSDSVSTNALSLLLPLHATSAGCRDPEAAMKRYGEAKKLYPTRISLGTCGEVDNFPSSIARSELYRADMFSGGAINNHAMDLPVVMVSNTACCFGICSTLLLQLQ